MRLWWQVLQHAQPLSARCLLPVPVQPASVPPATHGPVWLASVLLASVLPVSVLHGPVLHGSVQLQRGTQRRLRHPCPGLWLHHCHQHPNLRLNEAEEAQKKRLTP